MSGLFAPSRRALTLGLVLTITLVASEALAVITVMPDVAADLGGVRLYGWTFSAFMLGSLVGIVAAGRAADRAGPARPYVLGVALFGAGLVTAGLAPTMEVLVLGRVLQGLGAGAIPAIAYVAIGRSLPEQLRARMMAVLSTAWVLPGLVGPALSAQVADLFGWRWVFLGLLPIVAVTGTLALPSLARLGPPEATSDEPHRLRDGIRTAVGAGLVLGGLTSHHVVVGAALTIAGVAVGIGAMRRLLPAGTLVARPGLPTTILTRGLLTFAFFGADAYTTLTLVTVRGYSVSLASVVVTTCTLAWTAGSWMQARVNDRRQGAHLVRLGLVTILLGIAGMIAVAQPGTPFVIGAVGWTVAGLGMGLSYAPISLMMLREAPPGREGWASASLNLADVMGIALGVGFGGAAVAAGESLGWAAASGVTIAFVIAAAAAVLAALLTGRLPSTMAEPPVPPAGIEPALSRF